MKENNFPLPVDRSDFQKLERHVDVDQFTAHWTIWHTEAIVGLVGGFLAAVVGLILCTATYFAADVISEASLLANVNMIGTCLTVATVPLLVLGAYCLDKIDDSVKMREAVFKEKKKARFKDAKLYQKQ